MDGELKNLLNRDVRLPSIPAVAQQLLALAFSPESSSKDLADVLSSDPAIASTVLRHVNSPVYAPAEKIVSIQRAVVTLGFDAVTNLALMFSLVDSRPSSSNTGLDLSHLWRRSLFCAVAAKAIGKAAGESRLESLFLAGLLQDVGMLALDRAKPVFYEYIKYRSLSHQQIIKQEKRELKVDHADFGSWLLQRWGLPSLITTAIANSHETNFSSDNPEGHRFNTSVALSGVVADHFVALDECWEGGEYIEELLKQALGINRAGFEAIVHSIQQEFEVLSWVFEKLVAGPNEIYAMRLQAQRLLIQRSGVSDTVENRFQQLREFLFLPEAHDGQDILAPEAFEKHYTEMVSSADDGSVHIALLRVKNLRTIEADCGENIASLLRRVIGRIILKKIRGTDLVTCYGDVYAIIFSDTVEDGARFAMHRILEQFRDNKYSVGNNQTVELIMSGGIAVSIPHMKVSLDHSMNIALQALENASDYEVVSYVIERELVALEN